MIRAARHSLKAMPGGLHRVMEQQVPSGQKVELYEVLLDQVGDQDWVRFRFVAPQIGKAEPALSYRQSMADIEPFNGKLMTDEVYWGMIAKAVEGELFIDGEFQDVMSMEV